MAFLFITAIGLVLWGGYKVANAAYIATTWEKAEGTIVDLERHTWTCGKGVGECYSLVAGYHAGKDYFTVSSVKKYNRNKPMHMMDKNMTIYYSPANPSVAVFSGSHGPLGYGIGLFIGGLVVLLIFRVFRNRAQDG